MGQKNDSGRNASLDEHKRRAAGRQNTNSPEQQAIADREFTKGKTGGAFSNSRPASATRDGGGGADADARDADVGKSTKPARKRS